MNESALSELHFELVRSIIGRHRCASNVELAHRMHKTVPDVEALLRDLSSIHGVVLHPHVCEPWIVHPFSLTPTLNFVQGRHAGWWAPCIWCALGVSALVGGEVRIYSRAAAEADLVTIAVKNGHIVNAAGLWVHFAIPPSRAWDNVHQHCSLVLPFHSKEEIPKWCERYGQPFGEPVPIQQVAELARDWYGRHAEPDWRKWTIAEAQQIFERTGLTSPFWDLGQKSGKF